jgi:hypothetical protein
MGTTNERRQEERLDYRWPVWFSEDFTQGMTQGLMVDVSSGGLAFHCGRESRCPQSGQHLTVRFSIPRFEGHDPTATVSVTRTGEVRRVDETEHGLRRIAIEFDLPLTVRPAEIVSLNAACKNGDTP